MIESRIVSQGLTPENLPVNKVGLILLLGILAAGAALGTWRLLQTPPPALPPIAPPANSTINAPGASEAESAVKTGIHFETVPLTSTGIDFVHVSGDSEHKPFPAVNGSGIAAFDYDLDGQIDLYFATGRAFPIDPANAGPSNRCYRQQGRWSFQDVTRQTRLGHTGYSAGLAVGDFDSDGFPDVFVNCYGPNRMFRNQGDGTFEELPESAGANDPRWGTAAAFLDANHDGLLDLYVGNYGDWTWENSVYCGDREQGIRIYCNPKSLQAVPDSLLLNNGDGTFHEGLTAAGMQTSPRRAQGVIAADWNGDQKVDVYVSNDLHPNSLFFNQGEGIFEDATESSGAAYDLRGGSQAGMGLDTADVNGDGRLDLFVTNFEHEYNTLYENMGDGFLQDATERTGVATGSMPWIGWGTALVDLDRDNWPDAVVTNGHTDNNLAQMGREGEHRQPPLAWQNTRGRMSLLPANIGAYFEGNHAGRALLTADFDNDGDTDLCIGHQDASPALLRNTSAPVLTGRVSLQLVGRQSPRTPVGAVVRWNDGQRDCVLPLKGGGSYLSAPDQRLLLCTQRQTISGEIQWPSGIITPLPELPLEGEYVIVEPAAEQQAATVWRRAEFAHP